MEAATVVAKPTAKQAKVLGLIAKGKSASQIAKAMGISTNGVYGHIRKLKDRGLLDADGKLSASEQQAQDTITLGNGSQSDIPESMAEVKRILNQATEVAEKRQEAIKARLEAIGQESEALDREAKGLIAEAEWLNATAPGPITTN